MIRFYRLESGIRVILEPVEHTEVASLGFWLLHGSRDEEESTRGFSHFLEHMLFKGTQKRTAYQIAQQIEQVGGYLNAFTEKELTCFYCTLPADHCGLAVEVIADMITGSVLPEAEIEKEKQVVINEIVAIEDNPEEKGYELYLGSLWNGHSLSQPITGEVRHIQRIGRRQLMDFLRQRFVPANIVITAAGAVDAERFIDQIQLQFDHGSWGSFKAPRQAPEGSAQWRIIGDKFEQIHLYAGTGFRASGDLSDYYRDLVFSTIVGESMSSRLFQRLREDEGLCYSVYTFRTYFSDTALWTIYANTVPESVPRLLSLLNEELRRLAAEPPSEKEVADAKGQLKGNMVLAKEDMENRMRRLFRQYLLTDKIIEQEAATAVLEAVSRADMAQVIERWIKPNAFNLLAYGSKKLKRLGQTGFDLG